MKKSKNYKRENTVAGRLKMARERAGLTQEEVAEKLYMRACSLSKIENGHQQPSIDHLRNMLELYNVSADYIIVGRTGGDTLHSIDTRSLSKEVIDALNILIKNLRSC